MIAPFFDFLTGLLLLAATIAYVNAKIFRFHPLVAFMVGALVFSISLQSFSAWDSPFIQNSIHFFSQVDFGALVLYGFLSFLLFSGAIQTNIEEIQEQKMSVLLLSTVSVLLSTFLIGSLMYLFFELFGVHVSYLYSLVFGALISPTDPILVLGLLKKVRLSRSLRIKIVGEALFNDGIAIFIFVVLLGLARYETEWTLWDLSWLLSKQLFGSLALGFGAGALMRLLLYQVYDFHTQVFITLALVSASYDFSLHSGLSGPIVVVIAGLVFRNIPGFAPFSQSAYQDLYGFWGFIDELLNACLFLLMGLEILTFSFYWPLFLLGLISILVVLFARFLSVYLPIKTLSMFQSFPKHTVTVLTAAGLRGGISLALALSLPGDPGYDVITYLTYMTVVFSLTIQVYCLNHWVLPLCLGEKES